MHQLWLSQHGEELVTLVNYVPKVSARRKLINQDLTPGMLRYASFFLKLILHGFCLRYVFLPEILKFGTFKDHEDYKRHLLMSYIIALYYFDADKKTA